MNSMQCHRCKGFYESRFMVPLVDQYNRWDRRTYRPWCLDCWYRRAGALPPTDPDRFIPRNKYTRRLDKLAMGAKRQSLQELLAQADPHTTTTPGDAFTEPAMPPSKYEQLLELDVGRSARYTLPPDTPKAEDIIAKAGQRVASKPVVAQQNPSNPDSLRGLHTCEDGTERGIPEGKLCGLCGHPYIETN